MPATIFDKETGGTLTFDSSTERHTHGVTVTDHPVEEGADVSDHAQINAFLLQVSGKVTETPLVRVLPEQVGPARVQAARRFLEQAQGHLLDVATERFGFVTSCMLLGFPHEVNALKAVTFECSFKEVRIAESGTVGVPADVPRADHSAARASETDSSKQSTTPTPKGEDTSYLYSLLWGS